MKRYIFDLDGTLIDSDWNESMLFFKDKLKEKDYKKLCTKINKILEVYEERFDSYTVKDLVAFLNENEINMTEKHLKEWIEKSPTKKEDFLCTGVIELLDELKRRNKEIVILTNWFKTTQEIRLKNIGIHHYFDEIYAGDDVLKPKKESYLKALGNNKIEECIIIGDNYINDYQAPTKLGLKAYLVDKEHTLLDFKKEYLK